MVHMLLFNGEVAGGGGGQVANTAEKKVRRYVRLLAGHASDCEVTEGDVTRWCDAMAARRTEMAIHISFPAP